MRYLVPFFLAAGLASAQTAPEPDGPSRPLGYASEGAQAPEAFPTVTESTPQAPPPATKAAGGAGGAQSGRFVASDIDVARYDGAALPEGRSAITARVQVLLDRSAISPGIIDGFAGGMTVSALKAFERANGLPEDGVMDGQLWALLGGPEVGAVMQTYRITQEDTLDLVEALPADYADLAELKWLGFTSMSEKLAERFHMDKAFLEYLNPQSAFRPGELVAVVAPHEPKSGQVARIAVDKPHGRLMAYDGSGVVLADYPVTVGSATTPSPSGEVTVEAVAINPTYGYNPAKNFTQGENTGYLELPPGPNGPVGSVWIDLSKETYGIHGTPNPASLFTAQSHGCVRMTNWDADELAHMVRAGVPVTFLE